jgi:hypothetical protein
MNIRMFLPVFVALVLSFTGCDSSSSNTSASPGTFKVFVSNNNANERAQMEVTENTTFAEVKTFATTELNLAGQDFELKVAGKTPAPTDKLSDHGINTPAQPVNMPVGNILVKIKN